MGQLRSVVDGFGGLLGAIELETCGRHVEEAITIATTKAVREQRSTVGPDFESVAESYRERRSTASSFELLESRHGISSAHVTKGEYVFSQADRWIFFDSGAGRLLHQHAIDDGELGGQGGQSDDVGVLAGEKPKQNTFYRELPHGDRLLESGIVVMRR